MDIQDIDFVVTWVDGNDPRLNSLRQRYWQEQPPRHDQAKPTPPATQYANNNEIIYCLASILRHAPFVRRIHVITDQQKPPLELLWEFGFSSDELDKISIVDHKQVFKNLEDLTPSFNSLSIESVIHRAPGLADHFVYMNDDFFIIKPTTPSDYFAAPETPIINGKILPYLAIYLKLKLWLLSLQSNRKKPRWSFVNGCMIAAEKAGMKFHYILLDHSPRPMYKPSFDKFYETHPELLKENARHRFRHYRQFLPQALASCLSLKKRKLEINSSSNVSQYLRPGKTSKDNFTSKRWKHRHHRGKSWWHRRGDKPDEARFLCIQNLDQANDSQRNALINHLKQLLMLQHSKLSVTSQN